MHIQSQWQKEEKHAKTSIKQNRSYNEATYVGVKVTVIRLEPQTHFFSTYRNILNCWFFLKWYFIGNWKCEIASGEPQCVIIKQMQMNALFLVFVCLTKTNPNSVMKILECWKDSDRTVFTLLPLLFVSLSCCIYSHVHILHVHILTHHF